MPYQRNNIWWISYYDARTGKQVRRSAGPDFKEAKALEQKLRSESHLDKGKATRSNRVRGAISEQV